MPGLKRSIERSQPNARQCCAHRGSRSRENRTAEDYTFRSAARPARSVGREVARRDRPFDRVESRSTVGVWDGPVGESVWRSWWSQSSVWVASYRSRLRAAPTLPTASTSGRWPRAIRRRPTPMRPAKRPGARTQHALRKRRRAHSLRSRRHLQPRRHRFQRPRRLHQRRAAHCPTVPMLESSILRSSRAGVHSSIITSWARSVLPTEQPGPFTRTTAERSKAICGVVWAPSH